MTLKQIGKCVSILIRLCGILELKKFRFSIIPYTLMKYCHVRPIYLDKSTNYQLYWRHLDNKINNGLGDGKEDLMANTNL